MPAFMAEGGMPYWIDLMTSDVRKSSHFYGELLGWDFEELYVGYRVARVQGLPVAAIVDKPEDSPLPDTWVTYFLADDIEALVQRVKDLGGRVLAEPADVNLGRMALLVDTSGGLFGAIEPYSEEAFIAAGEPGTPVWHELTCTNHYEEAAEFYRDLFDWVTRSTEAGSFRYTTALVDGAPFAGIWDAQGRFPREVPSFWQSYVGVKNVDEAVSKAEKLGGEVVREPWESEFGRMAVVADSTGATVTIAEVDEPVVEGHESDPLEGIDLSQYGL